ncbi:site-2 protease family protein [Krasilnikoviella flava]|uniref:Zinc metalloprotease n=1 Tax=Krasilnikoviella flava TaxID=526729 RepID=A0A1T5L4E1_9MICO|nr:site-2 protease family protein [Krasilnikoviella flava]SKC70499.1 Zn-dependent protease (includes SpoIVFB) [Krasilnikoviella flava]
MTSRSRGWVVGRIAGAPVLVTPSWFLGAVVLTALFTPTVRAFAPLLPGASVVLVAFAFVLLLFASVFLHEVAHALVARARGHRVTELAVTLWGGHTAYTGSGARPLDGALVAVVGPLTNLALAAAFWVAYQLQPAATVPSMLLFAGAFSNAFVGIFNLLPGLPLDGGQVLESIVWGATGSRARGTLAAGWVGRAVAVGVLAWALLWPLLEGRSPSLVTAMWAALIGAFLWSGAGDAIKGARARARVAGLTARGLAVPAVVVPVSTSVAGVSDAAARHAGAVVAVVGPSGEPVGWVDPGAVASVPADQAGTTPVEAVVVPFPPGSAVTPDLEGDELLDRLARGSSGARVVPVVDAGRLTGVLDVARVAAALRQ